MLTCETSNVEHHILNLDIFISSTFYSDILHVIVPCIRLARILKSDKWRDNLSAHSHKRPKSSHLRSIRAISTVRWENGSWHWLLHTGKSQVWHECLHGNTFFGGRVGSSKKLEPTLNTSPANMFAWNTWDLTLMLINHILMVSWSLKVGTLPQCWDFGTSCGPAFKYNCCDNIGESQCL